MLAAIEEECDSDISSAFRSLLLEHGDLRNRLAHAKHRVSELTSGELSRFHWQATAHDMHAHISYTRRLLEVHAGAEQQLLLSLRQRLLGEEKE